VATSSQIRFQERLVSSKLMAGKSRSMLHLSRLVKSKR
jgi:hypothetical protein